MKAKEHNWHTVRSELATLYGPSVASEDLHGVSRGH